MIKTALLAATLSVMLVMPGAAQGQTAFSFVLISPSAEANGRGETSVACLTDDPLAMVSNPAQLGMQARRGYLSIGRNESRWLPIFAQNDLWYRTYAVSEGINLKTVFGIEPEIFLGAAYSQVLLNLGTFAITVNDPVPVGTFQAWEASDQYTLAAGIDHWVRVSAGVTFKRISSHLSPSIFVGQSDSSGAMVDTYDYGLLLDVPLVGIISRVREKPLAIMNNVSPFVDLSLGFANNNLGDKEAVYAPGLGDPLPRYARIGVGIDLGIVYHRDDLDWEPLSFTWTREANDILVSPVDPARTTGNPSGGRWWEYQSGLGDIRFFDEVLAGNTNSQTIRKTGWEFSFFELITVRGGRFEEDPARGNRRFSTSGFGLRLAGITKFLRAVDAPLINDGILGFIASHIDLRYDQSGLTTDQLNHPLSDTRFNSFHLFLTN